MTSGDPALGAEQAEALDLAVLLLLERLPPRERAAYILREAFSYPFKEIGEILDTTEVYARQLAKRARAHLESKRSTPVDPAEHRRLLEVFLAAAKTGDLSTLESLLAESSVSYSDGGGVVSAARLPVTGKARVARFITGVVERYGQGTATCTIEVSGRPAMLVSQDGRPVALAAIDATEAGIERLMTVLNPAKLAGLVIR